LLALTEMNPLDAVGDPALRSTLLFVRAQPAPVTAGGVASALGVPRTVARFRLERLADAGVVVAAFERRTGRSGPGAGRPAKIYVAAAETRAVEFPARRYEKLIALLAAGLPRPRRALQLAEIGAAFGAELAREAGLRPAKTLPAALASLCRGLGRLGFQAHVESVSDRSAEIVSATCPLRPLVFADRETRALDQGMWQGLIAATMGEERLRSARCETEGCLDDTAPCRIVASFRPHSS
jgi:predicted ArsR family transcriptional regulator